MLSIYYAITEYYAMKHWLMCNNKAWDKGDHALAVSCAKAWESLDLPVETIDALDGMWEEGFYTLFENIVVCTAIVLHTRAKQ